MKCLNVFIYADKEDRVIRIDHQRKYYYEFHTGAEWGGIEAHELLLNVSRLGVKGTVDVLEAVCRRKMDA